MKLFSFYLLVSEPGYWWGGFSPVSLVFVRNKQDYHTYSGKQCFHTRGQLFEINNVVIVVS